MKAFTFKRLTVAFLFVTLFSSSNAQTFYWGAQSGGSWNDGNGLTASDSEGYIYVSGSFTSPLCYFSTDTLICHGYNDFYLVKYDPTGTELWIKQFGLSENWEDSREKITGIVYDSIDNTLLLTGTFYQYFILPDTVINGSGLDIFVMKINTDGEILWIRTAGSEFTDYAMGIACDEQENIYVTGANQTAISFGNTTIPQGGYMAKYDKNGTLIWAKQKFRYYYYWPSQMFTEAAPYCTAFDNNSIIVYGLAYNDTIQIDTFSITGLTGGTGFIASFNENGDALWLKKVGGSVDFENGQISTDTSGNIFITGTFEGMGIFGNDTLQTNPGMMDYFLSKIALNGNFIWTIQGKSKGLAWGSVTSCDETGTIYSGGVFGDTLTFGGYTLVAQSENDIFLLCLTQDGTCTGAYQFGQGNISGMTLDQYRNLIFTGSFTNSILFGSILLSSFGEYDGFVTKCSPITSTKESPFASYNQLIIYANPTTGKCTITVPEEFKHEEQLTLFIYDSQGKLIQKAAVERSSETYRLDIRAQAAGIYQAVLTDGSRSYTGKIVFTGN